MEEKQYYKQINVNHTIDIHNRFITTNQIEAASADFEKISLKIIDTMEGTSLEGQVLTGKKLIVIGSLNAKIFIRTCRHNRNGFWIERCIPFSTFIIVPQDIDKDAPIQIKHTIEDTTAIIITCGKLFVSITLLLEYQDEY